MRFDCHQLYCRHWGGFSTRWIRRRKTGGKSGVLAALRALSHAMAADLQWPAENDLVARLRNRYSLFHQGTPERKSGSQSLRSTAASRGNDSGVARPESVETTRRAASEREPMHHTGCRGLLSAGALLSALLRLADSREGLPANPQPWDDAHEQADQPPPADTPSATDPVRSAEHGRAPRPDSRPAALPCEYVSSLTVRSERGSLRRWNEFAQGNWIHKIFTMMANAVVLCCWVI